MVSVPTTSGILYGLAAEYEALTSSDIHLDGRMQRALLEPMQTFLGRSNPYPGMVVTTSLYYDKAKVYHPGPEWFLHMQELPNTTSDLKCTAGFALWRDGGLKMEKFAFGATLEIAYCGALCRAWGYTLELAGR
jgi:hypothetical protein